MNIDYQDFEAIAALEYGTLEDWAYESAEHYARLHGELNMLIAGVIVSDALYRIFNK